VFLEKLTTLLGKRPMFIFSLIMLIKSSIAWMVIFENGSSWTMLL